jgi:HK97 family phage prohead protease
MDLKIKQLDAVATTVGDRVVRFVISTGAVDRDGDTIDPRGWQLAHYRACPVVLWQHDHKTPAIAKMVRIAVEGNPPALVADAEFAPAEIYPFAEMIYQLVKRGFLTATSVGFQPQKFTENRQRGGYDFTEQALAEFSIVNVPSNPECLARTNTAAVQKWFGGSQGRDEVLDVDFTPTELARLAASATRHRSEPFGDPRRRDHDVTDISRDDLRTILEGVVRVAIASTVREETTRALGRARGRVD